MPIRTLFCIGHPGQTGETRPLASIALALALALGLTPHVLSAGSEPPPRPVLDAVAVPVGAAAVQVDGAFLEDVWRQAPVVSGFLQREPAEGVAASHDTDVRVAFDADALYVAVRAHEPDDDRLVGHLTRRDEDSPSDWVRVMVDSYADRRTAFEFAVNAAGVKQDAYRFNDTARDPGWDAVWDVAVKREGQSWHAEFRIPFSQLRFNAGAVGTVGFAVARTIAHENETSSWPLIARSASGFVSSFGELRGLAVSTSLKRLELSPYVVADATTKPVAAGDPLRNSPNTSVAGGVDLKYRIAPGLTLTGTINPDFGQVEADPAVVNLSAFETFFAERRPFFVEGSGAFSFDIACEDDRCTGLFYSRRIGRSPQRFAGPPPGGFSSQPAQTTIVGAAKLTGRIGAFSVGALNAVTSREDASLTGGAGAPVTTTAVEPATSYTVARANREFQNNSRIGFMITSTNRRLPSELSMLPSSATTGGLDADIRFAGGRYNVRGFWAGSLVRGSAAAIDRLQRSNVHSFQRPDSEALFYDPARTALGGHAGSIGLGKISGVRTRFQSNVSFKSPGFEINDLGFLMRADEISQGNWFQIRDDQPGRFVRSVSVNFNQYAGWNYDGDLRYNGGNVNAHWRFTNNWNFSTGFNVNGQGFADRMTRGGPGALVPGTVNQWIFASTDNRRLAAGTFNLFWFTDRNGSKSVGVSPGLTLRPSSALSVGLQVNMDRSTRDSQWITNLTDQGVPRYVFGRLEQRTFGVSARVNYTISPTLTLQLYAQPFVSAGLYDEFKTLVDGRAAAYADRYAPYAYSGNPDFNFLSFRTTNVLRWEYRPGSAVFVVWQQGREDVSQQGDFRLGRDLGGAFAAPATNVFLVKVSRWLNF